MEDTQKVEDTQKAEGTQEVEGTQQVEDTQYVADTQRVEATQTVIAVDYVAMPLDLHSDHEPLQQPKKKAKKDPPLGRKHRMQATLGDLPGK